MRVLGQRAVFIRVGIRPRQPLERLLVTTNGSLVFGPPIESSGFGSSSHVTPVAAPVAASKATTPWNSLPPAALNRSPYDFGKANMANTTFDSSGETASEQNPPVIAGLARAIHVPAAPLSDTSRPSSPQANVLPPGRATASQTLPAASPGVGSKRVQWSPPSVVRASPQLVPTRASEVPGRSEIPNPEGWSLRAAEHVSGAAGRRPLQVIPPSVESWRTAVRSSRPSLNEVAYTRCPPGIAATFQAVPGRYPSR